MNAVIVGIDLAGTADNPTGWAAWRNKNVTVCQLHADEEIITHSTQCEPEVIAVDAPLTLPLEGAMRKADKSMHKRGYPVFPPMFPGMKELTLRAMKLTQKLLDHGFSVIEVHPASTRKALNIPTKDWHEIQNVFKRLGLKGDLETRVLTPHELDAVTATVTGYLYTQGKVELVGDSKEGFIVVPTRQDWRRLTL